MHLYFAPFACSLAARIVAAEAAVPLTFCQVELFRKTLTDTGSSYFDEVPLGLVPALRLDDGSTLTEVAAVVQYLADRNPEAGLAPPWGTVERYQLAQWLSLIGTELHQPFLRPVFWSGRGTPASAHASDESRARARWAVHGVRAHLARHLAGRSFLLGEAFSAADAYLVWALTLSRVAALGVEDAPELQAFLKRATSRPAVRGAIALERQLAVEAMKRQADLVSSPAAQTAPRTPWTEVGG